MGLYKQLYKYTMPQSVFLTKIKNKQKLYSVLFVLFSRLQDKKTLPTFTKS